MHQIATRVGALCALTALVAGSVIAVRRTTSRRQHALPPDLQRWEGEGGGVPVKSAEDEGHTAASRVARTTTTQGK